jgi:Ca2+-binding RTX toxin-like protein
VLPHSTTFVAKDAGKHPFGVTLKTAGLRAVTAGDGVLSVTQANILVAGASATVLQQQDPDNAALTALVVIGTGANDAIDITPTNPAGTQLQVRINRGQPVTFTPTGHVLVYGLGGNDTIRLLVGTGGVKVSLPVVIDAGAGNDTVDASGGTGDTIVLGGAGNDNLTGGSGNNIVIGGQGADAVHGGGNDILTGESTALDTNLAALLGLMAEWRNTAASPLTRARHLSGSLSGGLNGPYVLNGSTVTKDASIDQLFDNSGSNWFVYTGSGSLADVVKDLASGDVLSPL